MVSGHTYTRLELIEAFRAALADYDGPCGYRAWRRAGMRPSADTLRSHFGSFARALAAVAD